jgi:hypothetical protein
MKNKNKDEQIVIIKSTSFWQKCQNTILKPFKAIYKYFTNTNKKKPREGQGVNCDDIFRLSKTNTNQRDEISSETGKEAIVN